MPRMKAFGHTWPVASDELALPGGLEAFLSGAWCLKYLYTYFLHFPTLRCKDNHIVNLIYLISIGFTVTHFGLSCGSVFVSFRGTLINQWPRRYAAHVLLLKGTTSMIALTSCLWLSHRALIRIADCDRSALNDVNFAVNSCCLIHILSSFLSFSMLNPFASQPHHHHYSSSQFETSESWFGTVKKLMAARSMKIFQRMLGLDSSDNLKELSRLMNEVVDEDLDLVTTDHLAGLVLMSHKQEDEPEKESQHLNDEERAHCLQSWMTREKAAHYMRFADGCYGWPYYVWSGTVATWGLLKVMVKSRFVPRRLPENVHYDNRFLTNTAVIKLLTGLKTRDLVYVTYHNRVFEVPFFVALDHKHKSIVVAIRGTLSLEDIITDLNAFESRKLTVKECANASCHSGMLEAAMYVKEVLLNGPKTTEGEREEAILNRAWKQLENQVGVKEAEVYSLVITGHSLGAGVAAILAIILHEDPQYKHLKCFAFSPPGGLLSWNLAQYSRQFIMSVVLGDDIVGRLGLSQLRTFKLELLSAIKNCDLPKHEIFGRWLERFMSRLLRVPSRLKNTVSPSSSWAGNEQAEKDVLKFQSELAVAIKKSESLHIQPLFLPGYVMHIRETPSSGKFEDVILQPNAFIFQQIPLTPNIIKHHTPWELLRTLDELCKTYVKSR